MHRFTRGFERRIEVLEKCLGNFQKPEAAADTARRLELVRAAVEGSEPEYLAPEEAELFEKIKRDVPVLRELIDEGTIGHDGGPSGADDLGHEDEAPIWQP